MIKSTQTKTLKELDSAPPKSILWDKGSRESIRGLHVKIDKEGNRNWYLYYRTHSGTQRRPKIGEYPTLSIQQARLIARDMKFKVGFGQDPSMDRKYHREGLTINEVFEEVYKDHFSKRRFQDSGYAREAKRIFDTEIQREFGTRKIAEISVSEIDSWHSRYSDTKAAQGNRARSILSTLFNYAIRRDLARIQNNPCTLVKRHQEEARERVASREELRKIYQILERETKNFQKEVACLKLLFLTGSRPLSICKAEWRQLEYVEMEGKRFGVLRFSKRTVKGKTGTESVVLPPKALEIIESLPKEDVKIFGHLHSKALWKKTYRFWVKIRNEIGAPDLWARDARRTFGTIGLSSGSELGMIAKVLNHKNIQTTHRIYARAFEESKLRVAGEISEKVSDLMELKEVS